MLRDYQKKPLTIEFDGKLIHFNAKNPQIAADEPGDEDIFSLVDDNVPADSEEIYSGRLVYPFDTLWVLRQKLAAETGVPPEYQGLFINEIPVVAGEVRDLPRDGTQMINIVDYLHGMHDPITLTEMPESRLDGIYNALSMAWSRLSLADFREIAAGKYRTFAGSADGKGYEIIYNVSLNSIKSRGIAASKPIILKNKLSWKVEHTSNSLYFAFDQFNLSAKYPYLMATFQDGRQFLKKLKGFARPDARPLSIVGIDFAGKAVLSEEKLTLSSAEYSDLLPQIPAKLSKKVSQKTYSCRIKARNCGNLRQILRRLLEFGALFEQDSRNPNAATFISFYFSLETNFVLSSIYGRQIGVYTKLVPVENGFELVVNDVTSRQNFEILINIVARVLATTCKKDPNRAEFAGSIRLSDPIMFRKPATKVTSGEQIMFSRICQKKKQPAIYHDKASIPAKHAKKPRIKLQNKTFPGITNHIFCPTRAYPHLTFIKNYRAYDGSCVICCSKKPAPRGEFQKNCRDGRYTDVGPIIDPSNIYYVRDYNFYRDLPVGKYQYLPDVAHTFLNYEDCVIKRHNIGKDAQCYLLIGGEYGGMSLASAIWPELPAKLRKNIGDPANIRQISDFALAEVLFSQGISLSMLEYKPANAEVGLVKFFEFDNFRDFFASNSNIFVLKSHRRDRVIYQKICRLSRRRGRYSTETVFRADSSIVSAFLSLISRIAPASQQKSLFTIDKIAEMYDGNIQQFLPEASRANISNSIIIGNYLKIPVSSYVIRGNLPIIHEYSRENRRRDVDNFLKKFQGVSRENVLNRDGRLIGYLINNRHLIFFSSETPKIIAGKMLNYTSDKGRVSINEFSDKYYSKMAANRERYMLFLMLLNEVLNLPSTLPKKPANWQQLLQDSPDFAGDYAAFTGKSWRNAEVLKKKKMEIAGATTTSAIVGKIMALLRNFVVESPKVAGKITGNNIRRLCTDRPNGQSGSVTDQCRGRRLQIPNLRLFAKMAANELIHVPIRREQILNIGFSEVISKGKFTQRPEFEIIPIQS